MSIEEIKDENEEMKDGTEEVENENEEIKDENEEVEIPKKNFKSKVNKIVEESIEHNDVEIQSVGLNLFEMEEYKEATKKSAMTIYFEEEDLMLLKAISKLKNTTVNKTIKNILENTINTTRANLPDGFDVEGMSKEYDLKNKDKGNKTGSKKGKKGKKGKANKESQSQASENNDEN